VNQALGEAEALLAQVQGAKAGGAVGDSLEEVSRMLSSMEEGLGVAGAGGAPAGSAGASQAELVCDESGCVIVGADGAEGGGGDPRAGGGVRAEEAEEAFGQGNLVCDENGCLLVPESAPAQPGRGEGMRSGGAFGEAFVEHRGQGWRFVERGAEGGGGGVLGSDDYAVALGEGELADLRVLLTSLTKNVAVSARAHEAGENWRGALDVQTPRVRVRAVVSGSKEAASAGASAAAAALPQAAAGGAGEDLPSDLKETLGHFEVRFSLLQGRAVDFRLPAVAVLEMVQSMGLAPR